MLRCSRLAAGDRLAVMLDSLVLHQDCTRGPHRPECEELGTRVYYNVYLE